MPGWSGFLKWKPKKIKITKSIQKKKIQKKLYFILYEKTKNKYISIISTETAQEERPLLRDSQAVAAAASGARAAEEVNKLPE